MVIIQFWIPVLIPEFSCTVQYVEHHISKIRFKTFPFDKIR